MAEHGVEEFTEEQKAYLQGFAAGSGLTAAAKAVPTFAATLGAAPSPEPQLPPGPEAIHFQAQDRQVAEGGKLTPEETAKRKCFPLDVWDDIKAHADESRFPRGTDVLAFKYHGLFYVAPAEDSYMCRLRFAGGIVSSSQLRRVADVAEAWAGGFADVTTRANLQIRQIKAADAVNVLEALHDAGIVNRGAGADNIRNVTGSPTAGIDPQELIDTRPLTRRMHHYILNHREMYGLPRKFNIAFHGGGAISCVEDTNDIGFTAVAVGEGVSDEGGKPVAPGVYFRMALGGITGHKDFARDTGIVLKPDECVPVAAAVVRVFIDHGDRTDRKKARLKYLLDQWGLSPFLAEAEKMLRCKLRRVPLDRCRPPAPVDKDGHIGVHPQKQEGKVYVGVALPVGRLTLPQIRSIAAIADRFGSGTVRLTVWQNLLISDIGHEDVPAVERELDAVGLSTTAATVRAGLVACTGAAGCKYAAAHTKQHALELADYVESRLRLDTPMNIHFTGCPHSCAQHYMGDIGLLGTKVESGDDMLEGYHVFVGGGYGAEQAIGRELYRNVIAADVPPLVARMLQAYLDHRLGPEETFFQFAGRHSTDQLIELFSAGVAVA